MAKMYIVKRDNYQKEREMSFDWKVRKDDLQLELAQLETLKRQLLQEVDNVSVRMLQITGKIQLIADLMKEEETRKEESVN